MFIRLEHSLLVNDYYFGLFNMLRTTFDVSMTRLLGE